MIVQMKLFGVFSSRGRPIEARPLVTVDACEKDCEEERKIDSAEYGQILSSSSLENTVSEIVTSDARLETKEEMVFPQVRWERELPPAPSQDSIRAETDTLRSDIMFPSAEVCQIRSLMGTFDETIRKRYERVSSQDPESGRLLVELLEQFKSLDEAALICHGQHENMETIVGMIRECMDDFCPAGACT